MKNNELVDLYHRFENLPVEKRAKVAAYLFGYMEAAALGKHAIPEENIPGALKAAIAAANH